MLVINVCYISSKYRSHSRAALSYCRILSSLCHMVNTVEAADVVILHGDPSTFPGLYQKYPALSGKYVIGYCVWEATELPELFKKSLPLLQEVWTCSEYCLRAYAPHHWNVVKIPHVIERNVEFSPLDRNKVEILISYNKTLKYFLNVARMKDPRKNLAGLISAFSRTDGMMKDARLIIKGFPDDPMPDIGRDQRIIVLPHWLTAAEVNALYYLSDAYVSLHHGEGWGFTLSDSMLLERPVIATAYSGNLEFMEDGNSYLIRSIEEPIRKQDCFYLFTGEMKWAYPDLDHFEDTLKQIYSERRSDGALRKVKQASADLIKFSAEQISVLISARLECLKANN